MGNELMPSKDKEINRLRGSFAGDLNQFDYLEAVIDQLKAKIDEKDLMIDRLCSVVRTSGDLLEAIRTRDGIESAWHELAGEVANVNEVMGRYD